MKNRNIKDNRYNKEQGVSPVDCQSSGVKLDEESAVLPGHTNSGLVEYAGFWTRVAAAIIDTIVVIAIASMGGVIIGNIFGNSESGGAPVPIVILIGLSMNWLYYAIMESSSKQATLGKMACGIIVTDGEGKRISFGRATGRQFAKIISMLIFFIGYLMIAFTKRKEGLHDMMADTIVVIGKEVNVNKEFGEMQSTLKGHKIILVFCEIILTGWVVGGFIQHDHAADLVFWIAAVIAIAYGFLSYRVYIRFLTQKNYRLWGFINTALMIIGIGVPITLYYTVDSLESAGGAWVIYLLTINSYNLYRIIKKEPILRQAS